MTENDLKEVLHDLKNPLGFILNFATLNESLYEDLIAVYEQKKENHSSLIEEIKEMIVHNNHAIAKHTHYALNLVHHLLEDQKKTTFDFVESIKESLEQCGAKESHTFLDLPNSPLYICTYELYLKRILINILSNAMKALANSPSPKLSIHYSTDEQFIILSIQDNGIGICTPQKQTRTEAYYLTQKDGIALGLNITLRLLKMIGGFFDIHPIEGGGTEVRIHLPISVLTHDKNTHR